MSKHIGSIGDISVTTFCGPEIQNIDRQKVQLTVGQWITQLTGSQALELSDLLVRASRPVDLNANAEGLQARVKELEAQIVMMRIELRQIARGAR